MLPVRVVGVDSHVLLGEMHVPSAGRHDLEIVERALPTLIGYVRKLRRL